MGEPTLKNEQSQPFTDLQSCASIGGQAVMEGVMMRSPTHWAMAVRTPGGAVDVTGAETGQLRFGNIPVVRGIENLFGSLALGYKCLMRSAEISMPEEENEKPKAENEPKKAENLDQKTQELKQEINAAASAITETMDFAASATPSSAPASSGGARSAGLEEEKPYSHINSPTPMSSPTQTAIRDIAREENAGNQVESTGAGHTADPQGAAAPMAEEKEKRKKEEQEAGLAGFMGIALALFLFTVLPTLLTKLLTRFVPVEGGRGLIEGGFKMAIFVGYLLLVSRIPEMKRLFAYHGAEHKTIACLEKGLPLTVENVRPCSRLHPRCGTSFLFVVVLLSIALFSFLPWGNTLVRIGLKLLLTPLLLGISYEFIRYAGRHQNAVVRLLSAPGLWMQRITTREPEDSMIEVAIAATLPLLTPAQTAHFAPCAVYETSPLGAGVAGEETSL